MQVILASHNPGKLAELSKLFADLPLKLEGIAQISRAPVAETGLTFVENALLKARDACRQSGHPAIADDSGLLVRALNNQPGLYSARYAGEKADATANNQKLLSELADVPDGKRQANFVCIMVYCRHPEDPLPLLAQGVWPGYIKREPQGDGGFGYDPIFYLPKHCCTAAQLAPEIKNQISHRALASQQLRELLHHEFNS